MIDRLVQGNLQMMKLQRRLYRIYTVCFLTFMTPFPATYKLFSLAKTLGKTIYRPNSRQKTDFKLGNVKGIEFLPQTLIF